MVKNIRLWLWIFSCAWLVSCNTDPMVRFVDLPKVMDSFDLKKELEGRLIRLKEGRTILLDSMELELKVLNRRIIDSGSKDRNLIAEFEVKREKFIYKKQLFSLEIDSIAGVYDSQIANQLNQYIQDFGIENKYQFVFGAEGSGVLMYADSSKNVTREFVIYLSKKFKGK